jgi:hypothetical protein
MKEIAQRAAPPPVIKLFPMVPIEEGWATNKKIPPPMNERPRPRAIPVHAPGVRHPLEVGKLEDILIDINTL